MDGCDGVNVRSQFGYDALVNFPSLGMCSNSMPDRVSGMAPFNPIFGYCWDPLFSLNQMECLQSSSFVSGSQYGNGNPQHQQHPFLEDDGTCASTEYSLAQDPSVSAFCEDPRIFSAMINPLGVSEVQTYNNGDILLAAAVSQECKISEEEATKSSPKERRRKRGADENAKEWKGDPSKNGDDVPNQKDEKKQQIEGAPGENAGSKQDGDRKTLGTCKPNYIAVRARQGQATNSHSLAERVRREKISERMRVLQELVPGCSKITGKAVMLDEIINYVQSLQQQVEFLAMKLATVSPGINVDLERVVSKHPSNSSGATTLPGVGLYSHVPPGQFQEVLLNDQKTDPQHVLSPQVFPKVEQQNSFQI